ncbi:winged helix-turn-helix domain-containing protein [Acidianus sp. HS-5]|uniref:ArsR/SmtB family transcription factor n=1 Tax=Acidianus sp. HS-5 TaxID=2886040 RepID=UPI001F441039|nr:winged helix-turn-helix domain-containing protein [Acidianus sp. HS-5]BDC17965.1 transcriptional regulator [Acidianus sp. HS-5]
MDIFEAIANETRRKIIKILKEKGKAGFSDLMNELSIDSPSLAFHLRKLGNLIQKVNDEYVLTEEGKRAYNIIMEVEGKEEVKEKSSTPIIASPPDIVKISSIGIYEITPELVKRLKDNKNKLEIYEVGVLKIDKSVKPEDINDIFEKIYEVGIIMCEPDQYSAISSKISEVGFVTSPNSPMSKLIDLNKIATNFHKMFLRKTGKITVFDSPIKPPKNLEVELDGSKLTLTQGESHLKVECSSFDDAEINLGDKAKIELDGCSAVLSLITLEKLSIEADGSKAELNTEVKEVNIDSDGSEVDLNLTGSEKVSIDSDGSNIKGKLAFPSGGNLDIDSNASNIVLTLDLPKDAGIITDVDSNMSYVKVPPIRQGEKRLKISADVNVGKLMIEES